jgi:hypothetical protein
MVQQTRDESFTPLYDDPDLSATEFLFTVMRDRSVPIEDRVDAASWLLMLERFPHILDQISKFGELRLKEMLDEMHPAERAEVERAVNRLLRCNALGINQPLDWLPIKGHA